MPPIVTLYTRHECHLCDDAAAMLRALAPALGFSVHEVDVDEAPGAAARFSDVVPVVAVGERVVAEAPVDARALEAALRAALRDAGGDAGG